MNELETLTWSDEREEGRDLGHILRVDSAIRAGVRAGDAEDLLKALAPLEQHEYHRSESARLSQSARRELWAARARLAGLDEDVVSEMIEASSLDVSTYWQWLLRVTGSEGSRRNRLRGDLVDAVATEPDELSHAVTAWIRQAKLVRCDPALTQTLRDQLAEARRGEQPTELSHAVALTLGLLSGMPDELVTLHRDSRKSEVKVIAATLEQAETRTLLAGSMGRFHDERTALATASEGPADRQAPVLASTSDGVAHLVLARAELNQLDQDIRVRSLIEAVDSLRVGHAPRKNVVLKKARGVWRERIGNRRDDAGDLQSLRVLPRSSLDTFVAPDPHDDHKSTFALVRESVQAELESVYREVCFDLAAGQPGEIFPLAIYGTRLGREFSADHVRAAFNCLRVLAATATWNDGVQLSLVRHGQREVTQHMARSAPSLWGGDGTGRQTRRGFAGGVACVAQQAIARCDAGELQPEAHELVEALAQFTRVAVIDGLAAMLLRFRLTASGRRATVPPTDRWFAQVEVTVAHMRSAMTDLVASSSSAAKAGATLLVDDLDQLTAAFAEFNQNLGESRLREFGDTVHELARAAWALGSES